MPRCPECGFDWDSGPRELVRVIRGSSASYRACLTRFLEGEDHQTLVRARPGPDVWSALEYTAHMRDVLAFYQERIERVLDEEHPVLVAKGFAAMADRDRYNEQDIASVLDALESGASRAHSLLDGLTSVEWERVGTGSEGGERTVLVLARRLAHEVHHHLLDVGRTLRQVRLGPPAAGQSTRFL